MMILIIFFAIVFICMLAGEKSRKSDREGINNMKWTKEDSEHYYKHFDEWQ